MEKLPKDVIRLLVTQYIDPLDFCAIRLTSKLFHCLDDGAVSTQFKKLFNVHELYRKVPWSHVVTFYPHDEAVRFYGSQLKMPDQTRNTLEDIDDHVFEDVPGKMESSSVRSSSSNWNSGITSGTVRKGFLNDVNDSNMLSNHSKGMAIIQQVDNLRARQKKGLLKVMVFSQRAKRIARKNGIDLSGLHLSSFQVIDDDYYTLSLFPTIRLLISKM